MFMKSGFQYVANEIVNQMHRGIVALLQLVKTVLEILCWHREDKNLLISLQGKCCGSFRGQINGFKMNKTLS